MWEIDLEKMAFDLGRPWPLSRILEIMKGAQEIGDNKLFFPGFIEFQYGTLSEACNPHQKIIRRLKKLKLWVGYLKGIQRVEEEEEEEDKEKDKEKEGEFEGNFNALAKLYRDSFPGSTTGSNAPERFKAQLSSQALVDDLKASIGHYRRILDAQPWRAAKTTFATYLGTKSSGYFWRDFIVMPDLPATDRDKDPFSGVANV